MFIRVKEGPHDPSGTVDRAETLEPVGDELWTGEVDDLTAAALHAAGIEVEPGTWYELKQFKVLMAQARDAGEHDVLAPSARPSPEFRGLGSQPLRLRSAAQR